MSGDNREFRVNGEGDEKTRFFAAIALAWDHPNTRVVGYRVDPTKGLVFYWTGSDKATPFPFKMDPTQSAEFAWGWLQSVDYGEQPDHDGHNKKGWLVYCENWGKVAGEFEAFVAVSPTWIMYGK